MKTDHQGLAEMSVGVRGKEGNVTGKEKRKGARNESACRSRPAGLSVR